MPKGIYKHKPLSEETKRKMSVSIKGLNTWARGRKFSEEEILKRKITLLRGENHPGWKGEEVGYRALHEWVESNLGKAKLCEKCKLNKIPEKKVRWFQWANISHKYKRDLKDWIQLCIKCHKQYDRNLIKL